MESITRANTLLYDQTDRMKQLRSQKLYSDVIHNRKQQIRDKESVRDEEKSYEEFHHNNILRQVEAGALADKIKQDQAEEKTKIISIARRAQLEDVLARKEAEARERAMIGIAMKERGEVMLADELRQQELKQKKANENKNQVIYANEKLKTVRLQLLAEERIAEDLRGADVGIVEDRKNALKAIGQKHYEKIQTKRQVIIDAATKNLAQKNNADFEILYKQENEIKEREERTILMKEMKRQNDWDKIVASRTDQIAYREEQAIARMNDDDRLAQLWRTSNESAMEEDRAKVRQSRERMKDIKTLQLSDSLAAQKMKIDRRLLDIEGDKLLQNAESDVDAKFITACKAEIKRYTEEGKPLQPLLVALHHKQPDLIPGKLVKQPARVKS